ALIIKPPVPLQPLRPAAGVARLSRDGGHPVDHGDRLQVVVAVRGDDPDDDRHPLGVGYQGDLAPELAPIYRAGAGLRPAADGADVAGIDQEAREVDLLVEAEAAEE